MLQLENTQNWLIGVHNDELIINAKRKAASLVLTGEYKVEFINELKIERRKRIIFELESSENWDSKIGELFNEWRAKAAYLVA